MIIYIAQIKANWIFENKKTKLTELQRNEIRYDKNEERPEEPKNEKIHTAQCTKQIGYLAPRPVKQRGRKNRNVSDTNYN